ncbi:MAG: hypothetical protein WD875_00540 [Pirellulales bacterium]
MSDKRERLEVDREDLLAEATALVDRVELAIDGFAEPVVVGFRRQGAASCYFGADPAYHFNAGGELRRAYCGGLLYKSDGGRLAAMNRRRTDAAVELVRHDLGDDEQREFCDRLAGDLQKLRDALDAGKFRVLGEVSTGGDVLSKVRQWLTGISLPPAIARRPNVE